MYWLLPVLWRLSRMRAMTMMVGTEGRVLPDPGLLAARPSRSSFRKARTRTIELLASIAERGLWPASGISGGTLHTVGTGSARTVYPLLGWYAGLSALFAILLLGARAITGPELAVTVAAVSLLVTMSSRHLLWIVSGAEFPRLLRRSKPSPYRTLVVLAVFDGLALLAIAILLVRWTGDRAFAIEWVPAEAKDLVSLRHLTELPNREDLSPRLVIVALAAAAFFASLASQVYKFGAFRRDDDDNAWLGALLLEEGEVDEAANVLASLDSDNITGAKLQAQIRLAFARGQREDALALTRSLVALLDRDNASEESVLVQLRSEAEHFVYNASLRDRVDEDRRWMLDRAQDANVSVGALIVICHGIVNDDALRELLSSPGQSVKDAAISSTASHVWYPETDDVQAQVDHIIDDLATVSVESLPRWSRAFLVEITARLDHRARRQDLHKLRLRLVPTSTGDATAILTDLDAATKARYNASRTFLGDWY
jgi:hypothetical protein